MLIAFRKGALALALAGAALVPGSGSGMAGQSAGGSAATACEGLLEVSVGAADIGLPTTGAEVVSAAGVAADGEGAAHVPAHCLVEGRIHPVDPQAPDIVFRLALPDDWNAKTVMFGGGGFNGTVPNVLGNVPAGPSDAPLPVARGYATFASDSGHQANELGSQDHSFGLNEEAVRNFGGEALKKTRDAAVAIIKARYGVDRIERAYFAGGSTGGREALAVITRWPDDWDGAISWYPAWNDAGALLHGHRVNRVLAQPGAYPGTAQRETVFRAALEACDGLDGLADGLIGDQDRCNDIFNPATATLNGRPIRCEAASEAPDGCLSDAQIGALKEMNRATRFNFALASGETQYPGYNVWGADLGITSNAAKVQPIVTFLALGTEQPALPMSRSAPYISLFLDQWIKYAVTGDPDYDSFSLDPENPGAWAGRISELSTLLDTPVNLDAFAAKGGKLLLAHGLADVLVSTRASEQYYQRLQARMGPAAVDAFARYYEVPGYGHAVSSVFNAAWDSLTALEDWVEGDTPPADQVVADTVGVPGRTRPLCAYPEWPLYDGAGDPDRAGSFTCAAHPVR